MPLKRRPCLYWRLSNLEHPNADLEQTVKEHLLNHAIQVLLPYDTVDNSLQEELDVQLVMMLPPDEGYQVIRATLADIVAQLLRTAAILNDNSSIQAVSLADRLESNHSVAITPDGMLHLAVNRAVFARLGLPGVRSPSNEDRYTVSVDLRAKSLQPGEDRYAQVLAKLRGALPQQAFITRLEVDGQLREIGVPREALTPSYGTEAWMPLESRHRTQPGLLLPPLARDTFEGLGVEMDPGEAPPGAGPEAGEGELTEGAPAASGASRDLGPAPTADVGRGDGGTGEGGPLNRRGRWGRRLPLTPEQDFRLRRAVTNLHTWLGALACGQGHTACNDLLPDEVMPPQLEDAPLPTREDMERRLLGTMVSRMWKGLISQGQVLNVMKATSALVVSKQVPWAAVHVWGFADAPVAWRGLEHGTAWGGAGEGGYTVLFMRDGDYCVFRPREPDDELRQPGP